MDNPQSRHGGDHNCSNHNSGLIYWRKTTREALEPKSRRSETGPKLQDDSRNLMLDAENKHGSRFEKEATSAAFT